MRPRKLTLKQRMELRVAFRSMRYGQKCQFYREHAARFGCCARVIQQAVLG